MDGRCLCLIIFKQIRGERKERTADKHYPAVLGVSCQTGNTQETKSCRNLLCRRVFLLRVAA